jgi:(2Fe-2S) ferredoxin
MFRKKRYVLVCTNARAADHPKGSCAAVDSVTLRERLKELLEEKELKGQVGILATSCLDVCAGGPILCVMPDNIWYGGVRIGDAEEIVESHFVKGEPVERLLLPEAPARLPLF